MDLPMMSSAQRDCELVADLAAKGWRLCKLQVVSVGGPTATNQTRLFGDRFDMLSIPNPPWRRKP